MSDKFKLIERLSHHLSLAIKTVTKITVAALSVFALIFIAAQAPEMHASYIRDEVGSKTYMIKANPKSGGGTGFSVVAPSGATYIVTNSHVCEYTMKHSPDGHSSLVTDDKGLSIYRRVLEVSDFTDLCLIEGLPSVQGLKIGSEPALGEIIAVVGHPKLRPLSLSRGEITGMQDVPIIKFIFPTDDPLLNELLKGSGNLGDPADMCDAPKEEIDVIDMPNGGKVRVCFTVTKNAYMSTAVIYGGNSGSPVVDFYGNVVGVAFAADGSDNMALIVSLRDLNKFLSKY